VLGQKFAFNGIEDFIMRTPAQETATPSRNQPRAAKPASSRAAEPSQVRAEPVRSEQARPKAKSGRPVRFRLRVPEARSVCVAGSFNNWQPSTQLAQRDGEWTGEIELQPGTYEYRFVVDGQWIEDPAASDQATNPYGGRNSVVRVQA
jgi:1,4-alpha-glucan branching enzyme